MRPSGESDARPPRLAFDPRAEPGSLTWVAPTRSPAPEDRIVKSAFHFVVESAGLSPAHARELGREMGRQARPDEIADFLDAFSHLGIGNLRLTLVDHARYEFAAKDLRGSETPNSKACSLALGFLEGTIEAMTGQRALGAHMRCRSRSDEQCTFTVMVR